MVRFGDNRIVGGGIASQLSGAKLQRNLPLRFDGLRGSRIADSHGRLFHIREGYLGERRLLVFYSEGVSKSQVRKNMKLLKAAAVCR